MSIAVRDLIGLNLLGLTAPRALGLLLSSLDEVEEIYLAECCPLPPVQSRVDLTSAERTVFNRAIDHRSRTGLPFWDAALLELAAVPEAIRLLDNAMMHVTLRGNERSLSRASVIAGGIDRACADFVLEPGASLTFISEVLCRDKSHRHLPMIDFHAFSSPPNQRVVEAVVERLFPEGAILMESGQSYHAYGARLLSETEFHRFLGSALLCAPIVDRAYLAHQWIEGRCALRLTAGGGKLRVPTVVALIPGK